MLINLFDGNYQGNSFPCFGRRPHIAVPTIRSGTRPMSDIMITRFTSVRPYAGRSDALDMVATLRLMMRAYQTRKELLRLNPCERADIGISAAAAVAEAARLPWDVVPGPRRTGRGVWPMIQRAVERARTRGLIARLSPRDLRDIGVSPSEARDESGKYFWQR
jgi:uncharacterized protein YjiS (DUF1127 family)